MKISRSGLRYKHKGLSDLANAVNSGGRLEAAEFCSPVVEILPVVVVVEVVAAGGETKSRDTMLLCGYRLLGDQRGLLGL